MSEIAMNLARAYLAAYDARDGSYDPESEHHVLSFAGAAKASGVPPILSQPVAAMLASENGEALRNWAVALLQGAK